MKQLLKKILARMGLSLTRLPDPTAPNVIIIAPVKVGRYDIIMRQNTALSWAYTNNQNYGSALGRLVLATYKKYPTLHAIDIGANVGDSLAIIKSMVDVPVLCVEGDEQAFALLQQNLKQFQNVVAVKSFLGETTEVISATLDKQGWNATIVPQSESAMDYTPMQITRLDDLLENNPNSEKYHVLKIDAEGFDCRIIRGARNFIAQVKPAITFEYNRDNMQQIGETGLETLWMLAEMGYSLVLVYDPQGRFILSTTLDNKNLIENLHNYADGKNGNIYYYDLCVFHHTDNDIALEFVEVERQRINHMEIESIRL